MKNAMQLKAIIKNIAKNKIFLRHLFFRTICWNVFWKEFPYPDIMTTISSKADF